MRYFFSSDYHLNSFESIKYFNRPFKSLEQMNEAIIRNHNNRIKKEDILFHIGDFYHKPPSNKKERRITSAEFESRLNGTVIQITGNHDRTNGTKSIIQNLVIKYGGKRINLVHDPADCDVNHEINFVGHIHLLWQIKRIRKGEGFTDAINTGVDVWNYMPVTLAELMRRYNKWLKQANYE